MMQCDLIISFSSAGYACSIFWKSYLYGLKVAALEHSALVTANNFGVFNASAGTSERDGDALTVSIDNADAFTVTFRATKAGKLNQMLGLSSHITKAEGYGLRIADFGTEYMERLDLALRFVSPAGITTSGIGFELYQNQPNPFVNKTYIGFNLPEAATATLTVFDEIGRVVFIQKGNFGKGYNAVSLDRVLLNTTGVLYYTLETPTDTARKKMIQAK